MQRSIQHSVLFFGLIGLMVTGCATPLIRSQSPEEDDALVSRVSLVGDVAVPYGTHPMVIESVGLVTGLANTGSDPAPSPQRDALVAEMKTRGVLDIDRVLASPATAMVLVRGFLRPGIQKGDRFDIEVRIPSRSETTSLRGGKLLETRLKELAVLNQQVREGSLWGVATGPILVEPGAEDVEDSVSLGRGRILSGGVAVRPRPMGLVLKPDRQSVHYSARIGQALNQRFHTFSRGLKQDVADPQSDEYIEMTVHPRYKDNVARFLQVVRSVPLKESETTRRSRLALLERQLVDPITASTAAVRLEAIGRQAIETLNVGVVSEDAEVRFYAAEALAYLDEAEAVEPLAEAAEQQAAFRVFALTALSAMDEFQAKRALQRLLSSSSAETRYGAFRALRAMSPGDRLARGEKLSSGFGYHVLDVEGPAMVHLTRSFRPEIVIFGADQRFKTPLAIESGERILVRSSGPEEVTISRFEVGSPDERRVVSDRLDDVIRAIVDLRGTFPEIVQLLEQAKDEGALASRLEVDAVPQAGRSYERTASSDPATEEDDREPDGPIVDNPLPDLFPRWQFANRASDSKSFTKRKLRTVGEKTDQPRKRFFGRILSSGDP